MKTWKTLMAMAAAVAAIMLMTSIVAAAPVSPGSAPADRTAADPEPVMTDTLPLTHPVGSAIAVYFNIPYTQVMALHAAGLGFGEIARAYLTALASGGTLTPTQLLEMRQAGMGWGQIKKEYGIRPGGLGLGSIMRNKAVTQSEPASPVLKIKPSKQRSDTCPGKSCAAPGQQQMPRGKPNRTPKN